MVSCLLLNRVDNEPMESLIGTRKNTGPSSILDVIGGGTTVSSAFAHLKRYDVGMGLKWSTKAEYLLVFNTREQSGKSRQPKDSLAAKGM